MGIRYFKTTSRGLQNFLSTYGIEPDKEYDNITYYKHTDKLELLLEKYHIRIAFRNYL